MLSSSAALSCAACSMDVVFSSNPRNRRLSEFSMTMCRPSSSTTVPRMPAPPFCMCPTCTLSFSLMFICFAPFEMPRRLRGVGDVRGYLLRLMTLICGAGATGAVIAPSGRAAATSVGCTFAGLTNVVKVSPSNMACCAA
jgi:hypothetical protein